MTQVERTPKTSAATPMRKASFFLYAAKAAYLSGIALKTPDFLIAHCPWNAQPH